MESCAHSHISPVSCAQWGILYCLSAPIYSQTSPVPPILKSGWHTRSKINSDACSPTLIQKLCISPRRDHLVYAPAGSVLSRDDRLPLPITPAFPSISRPSAVFLPA